MALHDSFEEATQANLRVVNKLVDANYGERDRTRLYAAKILFLGCVTVANSLIAISHSVERLASAVEEKK